MRDTTSAKAPSFFETLESRRLMSNDGAWLGIDHGDVAQATFVSDLTTTGVHVVRDGFNAATTDPSNAAFAAKVQAYVNAGVDAHISINERGNGIDVSTYATWLANYKARCVDIMTYYKGKLDYYIVGNEPDKADAFTGNFTPQQAVDFTRMAYEASRQVDPTGGIKVESAPLSSPRPINNYLANMLTDGLTSYCDYIGIHAYSNQVNDGLLNNPWTLEQAQGGTQKPIAVSELGISTAWAPSGYTAAQTQQWMADFLDTAYVQAKRYGLANAILFESSSSSGGPGMFNLLRDGTASRTILPTTYGEIQNHLSSGALVDGGFESTNDAKCQWVVYDDPADGTWDTSAYNFQAAGGHSGSSSLQMDTSGSGNRIVRQVIGGLTVGQPVTLSTWIYSNNPGGASIKAEGYNAIDGDADVVASTNAVNGWKQISVTVTPTNPWVVLELSSTANGLAGSYVKFDDATIQVGGLPAGFIDADLSAPAHAGSASFDGSTFTLNGSGSDFWLTSDQGNFASQSWTGDGTLIARVATLQNTNPWAKAGVMFRASSAGNSAEAAVVVTPTQGIQFIVRSTTGASTTQVGLATGISAPQWVKLVRTGSSFTGFYSADGVTWTQVGGTGTATMGATVSAGLAVTSHNNNVLCTATFDHFNLLANPLPQTWNDADIGSPTLAGGANYDGTTYTVRASGGDIWGTTDQFNFVNRAWTGDGTLITRFGGLTNTNAAAKAGLMFRSGSGATAAFVDLIMSPSGTLGLHTRATDGASVVSKASAAGLTGPLWLKLARVGNVFTASYSSDGTTWTQLGTPQTVTMSSSVQAGLAVTSHNNNVLGTATFDSLTLA